MPWLMPWLNQMRYLLHAVGVGDQAQLEQPFPKTLHSRAVDGIGVRPLERWPGRALAMPGLLRVPDQAIDVRLLASEPAAHRNGAGDVGAVAIEFGGGVHQQQVAGVHACRGWFRSAGWWNSGPRRRCRDSPSGRCAAGR